MFRTSHHVRLLFVLSTLWSAAAWAQGVKAPATRPGGAIRLDTLQRVGDSFFVATEDGGRAELTLDPGMQDATDEVMRVFQIPYAGAVVLSIPDGRVLAMVGRSSVDPRLGAEELALHPWAPAASVFKVVSASALVELGGVTGATRTCYHGGVSSILPDNLIDIPKIDGRCDTLAYGIGKSQNAILAKLASRHLTAESLGRMGQAFGFGEGIPFELPVEASHLDVPTDGLEFARTAAGFWHSTLSPMHGALLAATIANQGVMPQPTLVDREVASDGSALEQPVATPRRVIAAATAREVGKMMELTTRIGTAKGTFNDKKGRRLLAVDVAGKTGTLGAETDHGYVGYSWFIGYAPADHPKIAFAVTLGNRPNWRIKATYVGRRIVTEYLTERAEKGKRPAPRILAAR
ncbi:MAG TPA: penicillin-binding transpeptidase domain-containing protein [Polyangia bacterium]|nr:penicillin-binding transpeptidase domain-containing protein [Polyangia bacterium]